MAYVRGGTLRGREFWGDDAAEATMVAAQPPPTLVVAHHLPTEQVYARRNGFQPQAPTPGTRGARQVGAHGGTRQERRGTRRTRRIGVAGGAQIHLGDEARRGRTTQHPLPIRTEVGAADEVRSTEVRST